MLESRAGEPPLTGREARHLVAVLDANGNGTLSREEFEGGLKECRYGPLGYSESKECRCALHMMTYDIMMCAAGRCRQLWRVCGAAAWWAA